MKRKMIVSYVSICAIIILSAFTCQKDRECHSRVTFINNSSFDIYVKSLSQGYPDTDAWKANGIPNPLLDSDYYIVKRDDQNKSALYAGSGNCYEYFMKKLETDTTMIYVFDVQVLKNTSWDTVKAKNMYIRRYDLSLQDLENSNWTITYP